MPGGIPLGNAFGKIVIDSTGAMASIGQVKGGLGGLRSSVGSAMSSAGKSLTLGLTLPLVGAGTAAAKTAGGFESQMNILEVAARSSGTAMDALRSSAIQVGADTELVGISASEAADAMTNLYKAGLSTTDIMGDLQGYLDGTASLGGALRSAIDLAAASELELAQASDVVAIAMATFGLGAEDASRIADSFVSSADASVASVSELAAAMTNVGPTAAAFGWSLEDTNTALAILSERGIRGSEAGTALKSMMTNMMRPTTDTVEALQMLGVALYDAEGNMRSLPSIMANIQRGLQGLTEEQQNLAIQQIAGTYGMKAMQTLLAEGTTGWLDMRMAIGEAATAQETAEARTRGFNAAMEQLMGSLEALLIGVGTPLIEEFLTPLVAKGTDLIGMVAELDPKILKLGVGMGLAAAAAGPLLTVMGALLSPVGLLVGAVAGLGLAWTTNFGGIRDIAADAVSRLSSLLGVDLVATVQNLPNVFSDAFNQVRSAFETGGLAGVGELLITSLGIDPAVIGQRIGELQSVVETGIGKLNEILGIDLVATVQNLPNVFSDAFNQVRSAFETGGLAGVGELLITSLGIDPAVIGQRIGELRSIVETGIGELQGVMQDVVSGFETGGVGGAAGALIQSLGIDPEMLATQIEQVRSALEPVFTSLGTGMQGFVQNLAPIGEHFQSLMATIEEASPGLADLAELIMTGIGGALVFVGGALPGLGEGLADVVGTALDLIGKLAEFASGVGTMLSGLFITGDMEKAREGAREVLTSIGEMFSTLLGGALQIVADLLDAIGGGLEGFGGTAGSIGEGIQEFAGVIHGLGDAFASIKIPDLSGFKEQIANIKLPDWLKPGSPPPLYYALMDIAEGAREVQRVTAPGLVPAGAVAGGGTAAPAGAGGLPMGGAGGPPQVIQLVVDGKVLAEVVAPLMGTNARRAGRMGGRAAL